MSAWWTARLKRSPTETWVVPVTSLTWTGSEVPLVVPMQVWH
jgi:hypothetical protein